MDLRLRPAELTAGIGLALMAVLAPLAVFVVLPQDARLAALMVLVVAGLDIVVGVALWPILRSGGELLALISVALRISYGAVFATAAGALSTGDIAHFQAVWDGGLLLFGAHLALAGVAMMRSASMPSWVGILLILAGLGYAFDSVMTFAVPRFDFEVGAVTFVGEVVLIVWLLTRRSATVQRA